MALKFTRAHGGVLTLVKNELEPFVTEIQTTSSRILPIQLNIPGYHNSTHINIYLPTAGREALNLWKIYQISLKMLPILDQVMKQELFTLGVMPMHPTYLAQRMRGTVF